MGTTQEMEAAEIGAILNTVKYLKYDVKDKDSIQDILDTATTNGENKKPEELESIQKIQAAIDNNPELLNLKIGNQSVKMEGYDTKESGGLDACTFSNGDEVYVVYRGTGDAEWIDNGEGLSGNPKYVTGTDRQGMTPEYIAEYKRRYEEEKEELKSRNA